MRQSTERLARKLGHSFNDIALLDQALTHRSAGAINNERFEFLGDAILGCVVADRLFRHFETADEGQLSRLRATLVKRETLAAIARELELGDYLHLGPGELRSGGQARSSILADAVEAIIAAVYLDAGMEAARGLVLELVDARLCKLSLESHQKDPKTRLQEYLQAEQKALPAYEVLAVSGEQHDQEFLVRCEVPELELSCEGRGSSRRRAEQDAARQILETITHG